jgi:hypothetical protein
VPVGASRPLAPTVALCGQQLDVPSWTVAILVGGVVDRAVLDAERPVGEGQVRLDLEDDLARGPQGQ